MDHERMAAYLDSLQEAGGPVSGGTSRRASGTSGTGGSFSGRSDGGAPQSGPPSPNLPPRCAQALSSVLTLAAAVVTPQLESW